MQNTLNDVDIITDSNVRKELLLLKDEEYRKFQGKLLPGINNFIGVRVPDIRKLSKKIQINDQINYIENYKCEYLEEYLLKGIFISNIKDINITLYYLDKFIGQIDNWEVCDLTASSLKIINSNKKIVWDFINKYINSKNEYELRFILVILLNYYICDEYIDEVFKVLEKIHSDYYYVKMAQGWLISMMYISYKDKTDKFLQNTTLSNDVKRVAIKKIIESHRISQKEKREVKEKYYPL